MSLVSGRHSQASLSHRSEHSRSKVGRRPTVRRLVQMVPPPPRPHLKVQLQSPALSLRGADGSEGGKPSADLRKGTRESEEDAPCLPQSCPLALATASLAKQHCRAGGAQLATLLTGAQCPPPPPPPLAFVIRLSPMLPFSPRQQVGKGE